MRPVAIHLDDKLCWGLAVAAAAVASALAIWPVAKDAGSQSFALLWGLLPAYLVLSSYLGIRLISWIDSKGLKFGKVAGVVLPLLFLLAISWLVFGRHFYLSAVHGLQSADQMTTDFVLRKALQVQQVIVVVLSILGIKRGGTVDLVTSLLMAGALTVLVLG